MIAILVFFLLFLDWMLHDDEIPNVDIRSFYRFVILVQFRLTILLTCSCHEMN